MELESSELRFETSAEGGTEVRSKEAVPMMAIVAEMMIFANSAVAERLMTAFPSHAFLRRHQPPRLDTFDEVEFIKYQLCASKDFEIVWHCEAGCIHSFTFDSGWEL